MKYNHIIDCVRTIQFNVMFLHNFCQPFCWWGQIIIQGRLITLCVIRASVAMSLTIQDKKYLPSMRKNPNHHYYHITYNCLYHWISWNDVKYKCIFKLIPNNLAGKGFRNFGFTNAGKKMYVLSDYLGQHMKKSCRACHKDSVTNSLVNCFI